jgi:hypothetical protein
LPLDARFVQVREVRPLLTFVSLEEGRLFLLLEDDDGLEQETWVPDRAQVTRFRWDDARRRQLRLAAHGSG